MAAALKNGVCAALGIDRKKWLSCYAHAWRALMANKSKLADSTKDMVDMLYTDIAFLHEVAWTELHTHLSRMLSEKWRRLGEEDMAEYLSKTILPHKFSRCFNMPGKPTDSNTLEATNRVLKTVNYFNNVEGMGTVLGALPKLVGRLSADAKVFAQVPVVQAKEWHSAQRMLDQGTMNLCFKIRDTSFVVPSSKLLRALPPTLTEIEKKKDYIKIWAMEYRALCKNPGSYAKLTDGTWDFDITVDMAFSFWLVTPLDVAHAKYRMLLNIGIAYTCTCPKFNHYFMCKHVLMVGLHAKTVELPVRFNTATCGKRKAPAGATLNKRGRCLSIDD